MFFLKEGWPSKPHICASVVHQTVVFLLLVHHCRGLSQVIGPSQPIVAFLGDDITLPCHLEPAEDASQMTVEWARVDLNPRFVHVWRDGVELETKKHPSYEGRTLLSINHLKRGDISLKLYKVKITDEATYRCFIPTPNSESSVKLVVGAVSSLIVSVMRTENDKDVSRLVLQCESEGWYPEPEVLWLDSEGHVLSAGPTETVRGPDGLYTVGSRVTVEERHGNSFTCRVQQKDINQTRETQIHVPDDVFSAPCSYTVHIAIISLTLTFMVILGVVFIVWKRRQTQKRNNFISGDNTELHPLKEEEREILQVKDLDETQTNLDLQLNKVEEECKDVEAVLNFLKNHKAAVEKQMLDLVLQRVERQSHESQSQPEGNNMKYPKEKQNDKCPDTNTNLDTGENEVEKKLQDTDMILKAIYRGVCVVTEKKKVLDNLKEQINKQLLVIEEQRDGIQKKHNPDQTVVDTVKKFSAAAEMKTG